MKKLLIFFPTNYASTLGIFSRLEIINYLSKHFKIIIITNQKKFVQKCFPECLVIGYKSKKKKFLPIISKIIDWKKNANNLNKIDADLMFMFEYSAHIALWLKKPVFLYVSQYGQRFDDKLGFIKKNIRNIAKSITDFFLITGLKKSKITFVVSQSIIEILKNKGVQNLVHIPHGVEPKKFKNPFLTDIHEPLRKLREQGYFLVTYTGWVTENRGFQLMLNSIRQAAGQDEKIVLVIAGADNHYSQRITDYAQKHHLTKAILNIGVVDAMLIPGILHYSDVCLSFLDDVPAYRISPPQKVVEYFAAGKPVICNKISTHEWLVDHGENGYILNPDPAEVSVAICRLKNDKTLYEAMADNAFQTAKKYDIDLIYENMVQLIKKHMNDH